MGESFSDEIRSVYVRNLLPTLSEAEIEEEFKNFGEIVPDGVVIRSRKVKSMHLFCQYILAFRIYIYCAERLISVYMQDVGVCYAFVEFEDMAGVHNAVKV